MLIGAPVLYVLSVGPVYFLAKACMDADLMSESAGEALGYVYLPLSWLMSSDYCPDWVSEVLVGYAEFWVSLAG